MSEQKSRTPITRPRGLTREQRIEWETLLGYRVQASEEGRAPFTGAVGRSGLLAELARMYTEAQGPKRKAVLNTWQLIRELTRSVIIFRPEGEPRKTKGPPGHIPLIVRVYREEYGGAFIEPSFGLTLFDEDREAMTKMGELNKEDQPEGMTLADWHHARMASAERITKERKEKGGSSQYGAIETRAATIAREMTLDHTQKAMARMLGLEQEYREYIKRSPAERWQKPQAVREAEGVYIVRTYARVPEHVADLTYQRGPKMEIGQLDLFDNRNRFEDDQIDGITHVGAKISTTANSLMIHLTRLFNDAMQGQSVADCSIEVGLRELVRGLGLKDHPGNVDMVKMAIKELCITERAWIWMERNGKGQPRPKRLFGTYFRLIESYHPVQPGAAPKLDKMTIRPSDVFIAQTERYRVFPEVVAWRPSAEEALGRKLTESEMRFLYLVFDHFGAARYDKSKRKKMLTDRRLEISEDAMATARGMHISEDRMRKNKGEAMRIVNKAMETAATLGYILNPSLVDGLARCWINVDKMFEIMPDLPQTMPLPDKRTKRTKRTPKAGPQ